MSTEANLVLVRGIYKAFNDGDLDRAVSGVSPDFELTDMAMGQVFRGPEGFRNWLRPWLTAVPNAQTELTNVIAQDDWVFTEHTARGAHTGPFASPTGEIAPTGRHIDLRCAEVFQVKNDKVVSVRAYRDTATLMRQLGLMQ